MSSNHAHSLRPNAGTMFKKNIMSRRERHQKLISAVSTVMPSVICRDQDKIDNTTNVGRSLVATNVHRGYSTWMEDYLKVEARYRDVLFSRRFGLLKALFRKLATELCDFTAERWGTLRNSSGQLGIHGDVKIMAVLCVLTKDYRCECVNDGARMGEESVRRYFQIFLQYIRKKYGPGHLDRRPTVD